MTSLDRSFDENVYDLNAILHPGSVFEESTRRQAGSAKVYRADTARGVIGCEPCNK